jgi:2-polyprenyl-3-methyl-5-hydroxy-6-metoxy-1,4-benzoquinol methylase
MKLEYTPLEKITINRPVDRLKYVSNLCEEKRVLDIGCYDETAIDSKKETNYWLHGLISKKAKMVIGIDSSDLIRNEIKTGNNSKIIKLDLNDIDSDFVKKYPIDIIVAGELIEHIENVQTFIKNLAHLYPSCKLILTTPNSTSLTNTLLALINRESNHKDNLHIFSYKTLNTICLKAGIQEFTITPYHVSYGEMFLRSNKFMRIIVKLFERIINVFEYLFPMLSAGYIVEINL